MFKKKSIINRNIFVKGKIATYVPEKRPYYQLLSFFFADIKFILKVTDHLRAAIVEEKPLYWPVLDRKQLISLRLIENVELSTSISSYLDLNGHHTAGNISR